MTETAKRRMTCPECLRGFSYSARLAGSIRPCPACGASIVLGRREDSPPKESPPPPPVQPIPQPVPQQVVYVQDNSTSNAIAAVANFFVPGLGHLVQGRFLMAAGIFVALLCCIPLVLACGFGIVLGLLIWVASIYDAATFQPDQKRLIG